MLIAEISESHLSCSSLAQLFHNGQIHAVVKCKHNQMTTFFGRKGIEAEKRKMDYNANCGHCICLSD